jgi:hypothetical protein
MKLKIKSYKQLLKTKEQFKSLLEAKKDLIHSDIELIKIETKPLSDLLGKFSNSERKRQVIALAVAFGGKTVLKKVISRTGVLGKLAVRYLAQKSHLDFNSFIKRFTKRISSILKKTPMEAAGAKAEHHST